MTVEEVNRRVAEIEALAKDVEVAHIKEDELYLDVLKVIAGGCHNAQEMAAAVLKADDRTRTRWYS